MSIITSKYINNTKGKTSYIGVFHYSTPERGRENSQIDMYGLLCISSKIPIPGNKIAKFAWDGIVDGYEYSKTDSTNESLKLGLVEATRRIKQLIANDKEIGEYGVNVDFSILVFNDTGAYIGLLGENDTFIYKENRVVNISEMIQKKKAKTAGLVLDNGDLVFLSTKAFIKENLSRLIRSKSTEQLVSALEDLGKDVKGGQGIMIFLYQKEGPKKGITLKKESKLKKKKPILEPKETDYIPTVKNTKKVLNSPPDGKDLKYYITLVFGKGILLFKTVETKLLLVKDSLKKIFVKIISLLKTFSSKSKNFLSKKLGKEKWFKRISAKFSQGYLNKRRTSEFKDFKIDGYKEKSKRLSRTKLLILITIGIALLLMGIKFTMNQREMRERGRKANEIFSQVEELITQAQEKISKDRVSTETLIFKALENLSQVPEELNEKDLEKRNKLEEEVLGISDKLFKRTRLSKEDESITSYFETLVSFGKDSQPSDIDIYRDAHANEYLLIVDSGMKNVFRISLYDKEYVAIPDENKVLSKPSMVYAKNSGIYVMDFTNGIVFASFEDSWFKPFATLSGLSIQSLAAEDIIEFAVLTENENVYILDRGQKSLLRATKYGTGYGLASKYLTKDEYENANDVLADLSVYILTSGEYGIHRYVYSPSENRMVDSPIRIVGLDEPLKNARYGFTREDLNRSLFIFDSEDRRILRFEKPLESGELRHPNELHLLKQYVFTEDENVWSDVKDFVVDFKEEYLYLLDGTRVWRVRL
jgi:hypothetical protein